MKRVSLKLIKDFIQDTVFFDHAYIPFKAVEVFHPDQLYREWTESEEMTLLIGKHWITLTSPILIELCIEEEEPTLQLINAAHEITMRIGDSYSYIYKDDGGGFIKAGMLDHDEYATLCITPSCEFLKGIRQRTMAEFNLKNNRRNHAKITSALKVLFDEHQKFKHV